LIFFENEAYVIRLNKKEKILMDKIKIYVLQTGCVCVDPAIPYKNSSINPIAFTGIFRNPNNRIWLPVSAYLIEHPKGLILFDTGWHREVNPNGKYSRIAQIKHMRLYRYIVNQAKLPEEQAIDEQLNGMGILPSDLDFVIMSHLDIDHASGLKHVKDAKKILVSGEEYDDAKKYPLRYAKEMWDGVTFSIFQFKNTGIGPRGKSFDLFGDGSIQLVNIPGHSNGLTAILVSNNKKYVLLFSDGGYATKSWKESIIPGITVNTKQATDSIIWIKEMSGKPECLESLANHDPDITPHIIVI
jgi:glyoxylase-like metal-dependent hydrolase (beta-lactamase superfamily II)